MNSLIAKITNVTIELFRTIQLNDWESAKITIEYPPYINKGSVMNQEFYGRDNNEIDYFLNPNREFDILIDEIFIDSVVTGKNINKIELHISKNDLANIRLEYSFDPKIVEKFESNLPKSKRGKTIPWYVSEKLD